jgi:hypothetical protein
MPAAAAAAAGMACGGGGGGGRGDGGVGASDSDGKRPSHRLTCSAAAGDASGISMELHNIAMR